MKTPTYLLPRVYLAFMRGVFEYQASELADGRFTTDLTRILCPSQGSPHHPEPGLRPLGNTLSGIQKSFIWYQFIEDLEDLVVGVSFIPCLTKPYPRILVSNPKKSSYAGTFVTIVFAFVTRLQTTTCEFVYLI